FDVGDVDLQRRAKADFGLGEKLRRQHFPVQVLGDVGRPGVVEAFPAAGASQRRVEVIEQRHVTPPPYPVTPSPCPAAPAQAAAAWPPPPGKSAAPPPRPSGTATSAPAAAAAAPRPSATPSPAR